MDSQEEQGLEKLAAWQKAMDFAVTVCRDLLPALPKDENYALVDQIRRAAQSIPANIAEGYGRYYYQEGIRFCYIARGSLTEVFSHISFVYRVGYISLPIYKKYSLLVQELHRIISGYVAYLKRTKHGEGEPGHYINEPTRFMMLVFFQRWRIYKMTPMTEHSSFSCLLTSHSSLLTSFLP